jgi:hypothetical protein
LIWAQERSGRSSNPKEQKGKPTCEARPVVISWGDHNSPREEEEEEERENETRNPIPQQPNSRSVSDTLKTVRRNQTRENIAPPAWTTLTPKKKQKSMETQTLTPVSVWRLRDQAAIKQAAVYLKYFSLR